MPEEHAGEGAPVSLSGGEQSSEAKRGVYEAIFDEVRRAELASSMSRAVRRTYR